MAPLLSALAAFGCRTHTFARGARATRSHSVPRATVVSPPRGGRCRTSAQPPPGVPASTQVHRFAQSARIKVRTVLAGAPAGHGAANRPRRGRCSTRRSRQSSGAILWPLAPDRAPSGLPVASGCLLPRPALLGGDPALADDQSRLFEGLPGQPGHALQGVVAGRRSWGRCGGRRRGNWSDLGADPIEERLQRIDGQQQRFDLFAWKFHSDGVPAAGLLWTVGACLLSHVFVLHTNRDPEHAERDKRRRTRAQRRVDIRRWRGGSFMVATRHDTMSHAIAPDLAPRGALHWWGVAHGGEHRGRPEAAPHFRRPRGQGWPLDSAYLERLRTAGRRRTGSSWRHARRPRQSRLDGGTPVRDSVDRVGVCAERRLHDPKGERRERWGVPPADP